MVFVGPAHPENFCPSLLRTFQMTLVFSFLTLSPKWLNFKMENSNHTGAMTNFPKEF